MKNSFERELKNDILRRFLFLSILLLGVFFICFVFSMIYVQNEHLNTTTNGLRESFLQMKERSTQFLKDISLKEGKEFLQEQQNERIIFSTYYERIPERDQSIFFLMDEKGEIIFSTQDKSRRSILPNYLKTVVNSAKIEAAQLLERVTHDDNQVSYYLMLYPVMVQSEIIGYSVLGISGNSFLSLSETNGNQFILADHYNNVLTATSHHFVKKPIPKLDTASFENFVLFSQGNLMLTKLNPITEIITLYTYSNSVPVTLIGVSILLFILTLSSFLLIEGVRLSSNIARRNAQSVNRLVEETKLIMKGYKTQINMSSEDEFEYLADQINRMISQMNRLYHNTLLLEKQKIHIERMLLDAQFNPHFLYNTLETIRITSFVDPKITEQLILSLNRILRYSIDYDCDFPMLSEDLVVLEDFLKINTVRWEEVTYSIQVESNLLSMKVPKLFLLPLIENALKYGMKSRTDLIVKIIAYQAGTNIIFEVWDNGVDFPTNLLESIQIQLDKNETLHGISNVVRRLQMMMKAVDLEIDSRDDSTCIRIVIQEEKHV